MDLLKEDWERSKREVTSSKVLWNVGSYGLAIAVYILFIHNWFTNFLIQALKPDYEQVVILFSISIHMLLCSFLFYLANLFALKKFVQKKIMKCVRWVIGLASREHESSVNRVCIDTSDSNFLFDKESLMTYFSCKGLFVEGARFDEQYSRITDEALKDRKNIEWMIKTIENETTRVNIDTGSGAYLLAAYAISYAIIFKVLDIVIPQNPLIIIVIIAVIALITAGRLLYSIEITKKKKIKELRELFILLNFLNYMKLISGLNRSS